MFSQLLSFKSLLCALGLLFIIGMLPESLYSQTSAIPHPTPRTETHTPLPSTTPHSSAPAPSSHSTPPSHTMRPVPSRSTRSMSATGAAHTPAPQFEDLSTLQRPSLITQAVLLSLLSLFPFVIMILTSFLKIVVVLSLLRTALGVQQAPPNQVINGVAFLLSLFIMYPTAALMYDAAKDAVSHMQAPESFTSPDSSTYVIQVAVAASEPMREFLKRNSSPKHQILFYRLAYRGLPEQHREELKPESFMVLVPSYITGQLKDAFEIGVLIYIPFFVIDLVTSNILLAMGMMMLSPVTISMPLKLFLLVMLDGWTILIEGLVKTFQ